jgi:hypothetical protein
MMGPGGGIACLLARGTCHGVWRGGAAYTAGLALLIAGMFFAVPAGAGAADQPVPAPSTGDTAAVRSLPSLTAEHPSLPVETSAPTPSGTDHAVMTTSTPSLPSAAPTSGPTTTGSPKDEGIVESMHESLSYGFLATATWLDSFFGNARYEAEANQSQFRVRFDAFREGGTRMDYHKPDYSLRLVLPQLRKKTRLVISGDPTVDTEVSQQPEGLPVSQPQPVTSKNVATSLQYFPVESDRSNFSIRGGVKLHYAKLSVLVGPRYRYLIPLDPWDLRFTQEVTWSSDQRWQTKTDFDLERPLPGGLFFRTTLEGVWTENVDGYPYALAVVLAQPLDPSRAVVYSWVSSFQTRPTNELVQELLVFGYRQRFWKPWLFLEIDPQFRFPRDRGFEFTPGILFRIEMIIGQYGSLF